MQRKKVDSQRERRLLIALIASKTVLAHASKVLTDSSILDSEHFRTVTEWCLDYFARYGKAPQKHIENIYLKWAEDNANSTLVESVKDLLEGLGGQYEQEGELNVPYLLDELRDFVAKKKLKVLHSSIEFALDKGEVDEAERAVTTYRTVEVGQKAGVDPWDDQESWKEAFMEPLTPLISFDGDAGRFFNQVLVRDALVAIQAPEKTGKTWWCVEFAMRALVQRRKVAFFEVGDLSKSQLLLRIGVRMAERPLWRRQCGKILIPKSIVMDETEDVGYRFQNRSKVVRKRVSYLSVQRGLRRFQRACGLSPKRKHLMTSTHPTGTVTVREIEGVLDQWAQEYDFIPDVIIIDYADILAPEDTKKQTRDQYNDTWRALRRMSQERHALVITPTQANAMSYNQEADQVQTMRNFSEDKRKMAHVTAMMALNQTPEEKDMGGMRVNWIVLREAPFSTHKPLYVGTCFALGKAICCASLG